MFTEASCKLLHRARSLRKLRADEQPPTHQRQMSTASDLSRASSSGSDTSRRDTSVEWDPLRLHPSMDVDRSPAVMPGPYYGNRVHHQQQYFHDDSAHTRQLPSFAQHLHQVDSPRADQTGFSLEVYEGFDFGFDEKTRRHMHQPPTHQHRTAKSSEADIPQHPEAAWSAEPPSPVRRRPPPPPGANDELKRGGWKRRGIVFGAGDSPISQEDAFEIP